MTEDGPQLARFMQENQTSIKELTVGADMRSHFLRLAGVLTDPDASAAEQLRSRLAVIALHLGAFGDDLPGDPSTAAPPPWT